MSGPRATTVCRCGTGAFCHQHSHGPIERQFLWSAKPPKPEITAEKLAEALYVAFFAEAPGDSWSFGISSTSLRSRDEWLAFAQAVLNHLEGRTP